jgi:hypothetical protein
LVLAIERIVGNVLIESTFEVGRCFRCTMRVACGRDPDAVIHPDPGKWSPRVPERLEEESPDWRAGRDASD